MNKDEVVRESPSLAYTLTRLELPLDLVEVGATRPCTDRCPRGTLRTDRRRWQRLAGIGAPGRTAALVRASPIDLVGERPASLGSGLEDGETGRRKRSRIGHSTNFPIVHESILEMLD